VGSYLEIPSQIDMADSELGRLKRKLFARAKVTRFSTSIMESTASTPLEDYEFYRYRLQEILDQLLSIDNDIQDLLDENEYTTDVEVAEEYSEVAKREMENRPVSTGERRNFAQEPSASTTPRPPLAHCVFDGFEGAN
jgi:hypothetical protein